MENLQTVDVNELENVAGGTDWSCVGIATLIGAAGGAAAGPVGALAGAAIGFGLGLANCN